MYEVIAPDPNDRRTISRLRLRVFLNEYIEEEPYRAVAMDFTEAGVGITKLAERAPAARPDALVALEVELPGTNETIWASAEPKFDQLGRDFHVSGLRFVSMARKHERLIHDYLRERRERLMRLLYPPPRITSRFA
jgi:hypothetical protein